MYKPLSLRKNFSWSLCGNIVYGACQWANLVILTKLTSVAVVGNFALASAVCMPIIQLANLQLRTIQITDVENKYEFGHFMALRLIMIIIAIIAIAAISLSMENIREIIWLTLALGLGYCITSVRWLLHAVMQKSERMDLIAKAQILLGILTLSSLSFLVWLTGKLIIGVLGMLAMRIAVMCLWDIKVVSRIINVSDTSRKYDFLKPQYQFRILSALFLLAFPLGITVALISFRNSIIPYLIEFNLGREAVGYFAALASLPLAGFLAIQSLGASVSPRLAKYYLTNYRAYLKLLLKAIAVGLSLGLAGVVVAVFMGKSLLALIFGESYATYNTVFIWLMVYATALFVASFLGYGLSAARRFKSQVIVMSASVIAAVLSGWLLIPKYNLTGAAWSSMAGGLVQVLGSLVVLLLDYKTRITTGAICAKK